MRRGFEGSWINRIFWTPLLLCDHWCWAALDSQGACQIWHAGPPGHANEFTSQLERFSLPLSVQHACDIQELPGQCGPSLPTVLKTAQGHLFSLEEVRSSITAATKFCHSFACDNPPGLPAKFSRELQDLLLAKGVPAQAVGDRIAGLLRSASQQQVALKQATAKQKWPQLCEAAGPGFRLVTTDEAKMSRK